MSLSKAYGLCFSLIQFDNIRILIKALSPFVVIIFDDLFRFISIIPFFWDVSSVVGPTSWALHRRLQTAPTGDQGNTKVPALKG